MTEPPRCPTCGFEPPSQLMSRLAAKETAVESLGRQVAALNGRITSLTIEQTIRADSDPLYGEALEVFDYWRTKPTMPNAREFNGKRCANVLDRLHAAHTVAEIKVAIDGCEMSKWHMQRGQNDLELICRDEPHLLQFMRLAEENGHERADGQQVLSSNGNGAKLSGAAEQRLRDRCERLQTDLDRQKQLTEQQTQTAIAWRQSYHEALDYLEIAHPKLAKAAAGSLSMRFAPTELSVPHSTPVTGATS